MLVDKPAGPTSHDVVDRVRQVIGARRVGHTGTLDPFATGLLLVLVGRATRLAPFLVGLEKRYTGTIRLGTQTDTDDGTGTVLSESTAWRTLTNDDVLHAFEALTGRRPQRPPTYSAMKIDGQPAHRRARRGEVVSPPDRDVVVHAFEMTGRDGPDVSFDVRVSSGTYIRALARDVGEQLGCGGHLTNLRRTEIGPFRVDLAHPLSEISVHCVRPAVDAVVHLPHMTVTESEREALSYGRSLHRISPVESAIHGAAIAAVDGAELLAVLEPQADGVLHPRVVLVAQ